ncbi:capsid [uncultured virus]|uniref:Capsid n=1 Tax=uncultured virus TaxID=340016 RepID=A0A2K9LST8_9VIRU|nr:capsid [uncultured virus]
MAFKRKSYRKKRVFKRRAIRRVYKRVMRPETKTIYNTGTTPCDTVGTISLLNGIQQGDTGDNREGRKITLKGIQLRGVDYATDTTGKDQMHRIMIVQQLRPNGTYPLINDILQATTISSLRNRYKLHDFKVLVDKTITLNASGESGSTRLIRIYKKLFLNQYFNSQNTGNVADIQTNALYLIAIGSNATGATAGAFGYTVQLSFVDN